MKLQKAPKAREESQLVTSGEKMEEIRKICKRFGIPVPEESNLE
jgi:hypothetical protein